MSDDKNDIIFAKLTEILSKNPLLCNYLRYSDYGNIKYIDCNYIWESKPCILNSNNENNNTQMVRYVSKIDGKFLQFYNKSLSTTMNNSILCNLNLYRNDTDDIYTNEIDFDAKFTELFLKRSINIDCNLKLTGISYTLLDFINKNVKGISEEKEFYRTLLKYSDRMIYVGDKCYLLAVVDICNNIYVNCNCLQIILKKEPNKFESVITNLYKLINRISVLETNNRITHFIQDRFVSPIIYDIYKTGKINGNTCNTLTNFSDFKFSDNTEANTFVKQNIVDIIQKYTYDYLNRNCNTDSYDILDVITTTRRNVEKLYEQKVKSSFITGLKLYNICDKCGWTYCDPRSEDVGISFKADHIYIKKKLNLVPKMAFINTRYGTKQRVLKDTAFAKFKRDTAIVVKSIYLDVTNGTMLCDGKHPNVSYASVCMGDIKGKISITSCNEQTIIEMLTKCEELLSTINYTSSYNSNGLHYFEDDSYSKDFGTIEMSEEKHQQIENSILDAESGEDDDFKDEIDDELTNEIDNSISNSITDSMTANASNNSNDPMDDVEEDDEL